MTDQALADLRAHCLAEYPKEACGYILLDGSFVQATNHHAEPTKAFAFDRLEFAQRVERGIHGVIHSHTYDITQPTKYPAHWPSQRDMEFHISTGVRVGIVACEGEGISDPIWLQPETLDLPLVGRDFVHGVTDCYSLIRAWFHQERGVMLADVPRAMEWWDMGDNLYLEHFERVGGVEVSKDEARPGDVAFLRVRSKVINHAGVITDTNSLLHQFIGSKSRHDDLSKWFNHIEKVVRYKGDE